MPDRVSTVDVAVVGGGIGGLTAAAYAARGGRSVLLCEKASALGGRGMTTELGEFRFNLGPHALYAGGHGIRALRELGVAFVGTKPSPSGSFAIRGGAKHALPGGFLSLVTTGLFGLPAKLETARLLASFGKIDPKPLASVTVSDWLDQAVRNADVRGLVEALVRVSSYSNDPTRMSAGAAVAQIQEALGKGVLYLDGGWRTLVDGLRAAATSAGARITTGSRVAAVERGNGGWQLRLTDGGSVTAGAVVLAGGPELAASVLSGPEREQANGWVREAIPVKAACLDLALSRLPQPRAAFALGIDRPLYLSVHSAYAKLGPAGAAVIHVAKYLGPDGSDPKADERELEGLMDLVQPGWRTLVVQRRFLPDMLVVNALATAAGAGVEGRPGPAVAGADGLFIVGDWVGGEGMLVDASLASAKRAAGMILAGRQNGARAAA